MMGLAATASAKPLLQGSYEVVKAGSPKGEEMDLRKAMLTGDTVWGRMQITFDGNHVTVASANLDLVKGSYKACEAELTFDVQWTSKGFSVPAKLSSNGRQRTFQKLDSQTDTSHEDHCGVNIEKQTFVVKGGDAPTLKSDKVTLYLVPTDEVKVDWTKHVRQ